MKEWRTLGLALAALAAILGAIGMKASNEAVRELASAAIWMVGALAGRSAVQALGSGAGVKGAVASLMTDAKPGGA